MATDLKSRVSMAKFGTIILGVVVMGIGLYSHFQSDWTKLDVINPDLGLSGKLHKVMCDSIKLTNFDANCPPISMERYYAAMVIITFSLSVMGLLASFVVDLAANPFRLVDLGYHGISAVLLMIAAVVYLISAVQIEDLELEGGTGFDVLGTAKFAAGALTILDSIMYAVVAFLIGRQS